MRNVLILGGTAEARALAEALVGEGVDVTSSLAGRVRDPKLPVGEVRIGGFGGVDGLTAYLREHRVTHVVDATHPFAAQMRRHALDAAARAGVPLVRLARPGWSGHPDAGSWHWVDTYDDARVRAEELGVRPFLTTGRQTLEHFASWTDRDVVVRVVVELDEVPSRWTVVQDRGPYTRDGEIAVMREHAVDVLLTKDSGGGYTAAKLDAARELGVPVVVVRRPPDPEGLASVTEIEEVRRWLPASGPR